MNNTKMDIPLAIGEFVQKIDYDLLPERIKDTLKTCVLHGLITGLAGYDLMPSITSRQMTKKYDSKQDVKAATILGDGTKVSVTGATFANSSLLHARNQEDTLGSGIHGGSVVIPAVLAIAESNSCTGKQVLEAILVGYEVSTALANGISNMVAARGFRPNSLYGGFGAAAAVAKLLELSPEETANAVRMAASFSGGITEPFAAGTSEWMFQTALFASNGVTAALLAAEGVEGAGSAFDGKNGFMKVFAGVTDPSVLENAVAGLGKKYYIDDITFKKYPTCMNNQTPFIMTLGIVEENDILPDQVAEISYYMEPNEARYPGIQYKGPYSTAPQCVMSTAFNLAVAIKYRSLYKRYQGECTDQELLNIVDKVTVYEDENLKPLCGRIKMTLTDGRVIEKEMNVTTKYYKLAFEEDVKLMNIASEEVGIPQGQTDRIVACVRELDKAKDVTTLIGSMQR